MEGAVLMLVVWGHTSPASYLWGRLFLSFCQCWGSTGYSRSCHDHRPTSGSSRRCPALRLLPAGFLGQQKALGADERTRVGVSGQPSRRTLLQPLFPAVSTSHDRSGVSRLRTHVGRAICLHSRALILPESLLSRVQPPLLKLTIQL